MPATIARLTWRRLAGVAQRLRKVREPKLDAELQELARRGDVVIGEQRPHERRPAVVEIPRCNRPSIRRSGQYEAYMEEPKGAAKRAACGVTTWLGSQKPQDRAGQGALTCGIPGECLCYL